MYNDDAAVLEPIVRTFFKTRATTNIIPPYVVIVYNDDDHTFPYVISCFRKVFGYSADKCFKLARDIHDNGRSVVWHGSKEVAELKVDLIRSAGPDHFAIKKVDWPIRVEIEPMAP